MISLLDRFYDTPLSAMYMRLLVVSRSLAYVLHRDALHKQPRLQIERMVDWFQGQVEYYIRTCPGMMSISSMILFTGVQYRHQDSPPPPKKKSGNILAMLPEHQVRLKSSVLCYTG